MFSLKKHWNRHKMMKHLTKASEMKEKHQKTRVSSKKHMIFVKIIQTSRKRLQIIKKHMFLIFCKFLLCFLILFKFRNCSVRSWIISVRSPYDADFFPYDAGISPYDVWLFPYDQRTMFYCFRTIFYLSSHKIFNLHSFN